MSARFSETLMDHFQDPYNRGPLEHPTGVGVSGVPGQGPYFVIHLKSADRVVTQARFQCHNCGVTVASGSVLIHLKTLGYESLYSDTWQLEINNAHRQKAFEFGKRLLLTHNHDAVLAELTSLLLGVTHAADCTLTRKSV